MKAKHLPYRDLALTVLTILIVYWFFPRPFLLFVMAGFVCVGLLFKSVRNINQILWEKITHLMSFVFPPIFLTVIFFFALVPFGLLFKLFQKSNVNHQTTNFQDLDDPIDLSYFERVW